MGRFRIASAIGSCVTSLAKARHFLPAATSSAGGEQSRTEAAGLLVGLQWDLVQVLSFLAWQSEEGYARLGIWNHVLDVIERVDHALVEFDLPLSPAAPDDAPVVDRDEAYWASLAARLNRLMNSTEDLLK